MGKINVQPPVNQKELIARFQTLSDRYTDTFQFLVDTVAQLTDMALCTVVFIEEGDSFVLASTDDSVLKIWPRDYYDPEDFVDTNNLEFNIPTSALGDIEVKFWKAHYILNSDNEPIATLNVFDNKDRTLTQSDEKILQRAGAQITKWIASKEQGNQLEKLESLFQLSNDMVGINTFEGKFVKLNPAFSQTLGWSDDVFMSGSFFEYLHEDDVERTKLIMKDLRNGIPLLNFLNRYYTKDNKVKWIEWTSIPEIETRLIYVIGREVTDIVEREQLLQKSEQKFRSLFENIEGILSIHGLDGKFLEVNSSGLEASGFSKEEMQQSSLFDLVAPQKHDEIKEYLNAVKKYGKASGEMAIIKKNGKKAIWYFMSRMDEDSLGNKQILANIMDVTERHRIANELIKAKVEAEQAYIIKSEFVANMSHEIRTPLNGIIGFTELALATNLDETQKQYLEIINQSGASLYGIINDILDFSKMESKHMKLNLEKVELEEVISNAFNIVSFGVKKKNLEMLLDIDHNIPKYIWVDAMRIKQILVNLLGNALKFTEQGEVKLSVTVLEDYGNDKMLLRFEILDTGIGINVDKLEDIFKPFTQEDGSITKNYGGTGLGLTISNKLLALANSHLQLESKQGEGSNFFFDLKVKTEKDDVETSLSDIKKVLIVDDNTNNRHILRRMLEIRNIEVEEADSGLKALLTIMDNPDFDVIIMDYHMPIMDGIETIRKIKEIQAGQDIKPAFLVLYSSSDDEALQSACDELEIKTRLVKPIRMNQMYQALGALKTNAQAELEYVAAEEKENIDLRIKVMIAEDNPVNMTLTKIFVNQLLPSARIIEAIDGQEAVELYQVEQPEIIFMDVQMPKLNGLEATKKIRSLEKDIEIPIIALTAGSLKGEKEKCLAAGMSDYLTKPLLQSTFADMLEKWLGKKTIESP